MYNVKNVGYLFTNALNDFTTVNEKKNVQKKSVD